MYRQILLPMQPFIGQRTVRDINKFIVPSDPFTTGRDRDRKQATETKQKKQQWKE